jgi:hypothetical protein
MGLISLLEGGEGGIVLTFQEQEEEQEEDKLYPVTQPLQVDKDTTLL